jgi:hypothetical protein
MRALRVMLTAAALAPAVGCTWIKNWGDKGPPPHRDGEKLPDVAPNRLVKYLNDRAAQFHSVNYGDVRLSCSQGVMPLPQLEGNLVCVQPRNFRMKAQTRMPGGTIDLGSNDQQFWMYLQVPAEKPLYVYASHSDFESGKARLPGNLPFEPDWVMQALGMTTLPPGDPTTGAPYRVEVNPRDWTYTLSWPATTPSGTQIIKEIVFNGDSASPPRPQVKRYAVRDAAKKKLICWAEIKAAQTLPVGTDPETGYPLAIQYPTRVVLRWEEQKFEMDMTLEQAQVNKPPSADQARAWFTRPVIQNVNPIDLVNYREIR